ncbi:MAG: Kynurenine formamidase [Phycisphaerales bacterium]|nr:Kynurenine formamidase [Phycisphaerales bacterium]
MRLIDLSQPVYAGCPNCPAHPPVRSDLIATHAVDGWQCELLTLTNHTGSHVDAPLHKVAGGASLDDLPLSTWVGPAWIADLRDSAADRPITGDVLAAALPADLPAGAIVLLATGWGDRRAATDEWRHHSPFVHPDGARWLVERRVRGVGIDHYSIGGFGPLNADTHTVLLGNGVWVVEELKFPPEVFALPAPLKFWSLPVNLAGHTGAFCRPVVEVND